MDQSIDKSARSVFVGNIPYEATEEKLKDIFSSVGPVVSFKLVYDRDNGKPRGYGFCEFMDPETAMSAMRNLNGVEVSGRALRVDSASNEKNEIQPPNLAQGAGTGGMMGSLAGAGPAPAQEPNIYGEPVDPEKAPEAITKAVSTLPPEQMFELMKQMKDCIINNPQEARDMLLKNPQLAYALLQALVVMKIVDPEMAISMLHKQAPKPMLVGVQQGGNDRFNRMEGHPFGGDVDRRGPDSRMDDRYDRRDPRDSREHSRDRDPRDRFGSNERDARDRYQQPDPRGDRDPRAHRDPRGSGAPRRLPESDASNAPHGIPPHLANSDPDKAQLIMQVLQLTDAQIAMLPAEQRASILELKKQIAHTPN